MDFNALIADLRTSSENLPKDSADRSLLSSVYCNKACTVLDQIAENTDYDNTITGLWLVAAHFAEQLSYLKPVPALSELCFKLFRQCAKAVLNIQWQNLEEDSSLRQNFLASLANLHAKLVPLDFPRFRLLEGLTENPWTNPTLAKVMGGEVEDNDKEEVRCYIEQEDPIILQLRVDMMLKENCEEYALNLCNSCLSHPELQSDLGVRKTQLSLLYKLGQEDKLQEECQKLSIQDAVRIIKQLQTSKTHRQICTVLAQTFMVQNWIRPSDMEANKELLRLWIRQQLLVDREQDQFKESVWAMAKLSQSTEQIIIFINVLREECGETFLQLYVDMCIFAINVDKGQMETNKKEGNLEAAAARRSDMASICAKLSCLCHHASVKVARICSLTSFALKPTEQSFTKIGSFYGQGTDCCNKCGQDRNRDPGTLNPATLYEVERLLNMLRPDYLSPDQSYVNIQILCRRFLQESLRTAQQLQRKQLISQNAPALPPVDATQVDRPAAALIPATSSRPTNVFEALAPQDFQNTQILLNKMRLQNITHVKPPMQAPSPSRHIHPSGTARSPIVQPGQKSHFSPPGQTNKPQYIFDAERVKNKQPYGVPLEQQHQYYLIKHEKELEQRRKNAQKKREEKTQQSGNLSSPIQQQGPQLLQQRDEHIKQQHNEQVTQMIQTALKQDPNALQKLTQGASPGVVQAVLNIMKGTMLKQSTSSNPQQQQSMSQQVKPIPSSSSQHGNQPLPTVSTLLKPSPQTQQLQKQHQQQHKQEEAQQLREQSPPRRHPRPQLYAQPIIVSTASSAAPMRYQQPSSSMLNSRNLVTSISPASSVGEKQKAENYMLAKSHVEDIRQFMQVQMSNLQQKQISEPRQMSGSTVTMTNMPAANSYNLTNRPKTTVELAEQAALAKIQKQENAKSGIYPQSQQLKSNNEQTFNCQPGQMFAKHQQQFIPSTSRANTNVQLQSPHHHHQQHTKSLHQQQQNNVFSFQHNQNSCSSTNSLLPSSDELSGSIMGIDDTIIKELLQDSGILANTFPDIEVDTITEDKSRKVPDFSSVPQSGMSPNSNQMPKPTKIQQYRYSSPPIPHLYSSTQIHSATKMSQPQHVASASYHHQHHPGGGINKYPPPPRPPSISTNSLPQPSLNKPLMSQSALSTFSSNPVPGSPQQWSNRKHVPQRDNISVLTMKDMKPEAKPTVDQLREMMKKEDIQGEIYMDAANNATYRCIICSFAFETLDHLREHVRNVCKPGLQSSSVYNNKIKQDRANSAKAGVETTTVFQCLRCFELCVSDAGIKQHRLTCKRVPTVPSDLKKEAPNNKPKTLPKPTAMKPPLKKDEQQDNSYKVPDLPLPFPYPSLNADAVLKSMSMAGSFISQSRSSSPTFGSKPHPSASPGAASIKSTNSSPASFSSVSSITSSISHSRNIPSSSSPATSVNTHQAPFTSPSNITTVNQQNLTSNPHLDINKTSQTTFLPHNEAMTMDLVEADISLVERDLNLQDVDKLPPTEGPEIVKEDSDTPKEKPETVSAPRCTEITGSGGSKFYKCGICSQTLCSLESFLVHWEECAVKNKSLLRKLELKEKASNAKPITGEVLENLLQVLEVVADGSGNILDTVDSDSEWCDVDDLCSLRDPCVAELLDGTGSGEDSGSASSYETEACDSLESMYDTDDAVDERRGGRSAGCVNDVSDYTDMNDGQDIDCEDELEEAGTRRSRRKFVEDTEDEADSMSDSERSYVSTREVPPKLRDRKTLRPIYNFINDPFDSSFAKSALKPSGAKLDERSKDEMAAEKTSSDSEVESNGDSLYCKVCQASYQTKRILLQHFAGKHLQPYTVKTVADSSSYFCHLCQKTFSTFMHYMQHIPNHSVTIYEKMKAFINSRKSSQRSERIASQRGLTKRNNIIPKISKALKSRRAPTKSAVEQLNQQLLADKTQSMRERLRISKRKRSLPSTFTSSEDEYSSDASNNVVFKSKKSAEAENLSDGQKPLTRSSNSRRQKSQSHHREDDSSTQSSLDHSGDEKDRGPRLARVQDDDYVLSEDYDSDGMDTITPPTTRSRKRYVQSVRSSHYKRKRISYDSEPSEENVHEIDDRNGQQKVGDLMLLDSDVDSNCSDLLLSQCQDGKFVLFNNKQGESSESDHAKEAAQTGENGRELVPARVVFVRSLTKQQKEKLKSCNLHPTVLLESLDALETPLGQDTPSAEMTPDLQTPNSPATPQVSVPEHPIVSETSTPAPIKTRNASFLDSFLNYLNQCPLSEEEIQQERKRSKSDPPGVKGSQKRSSSCDLAQTQDKSKVPAVISRGSSTETELPESFCETGTSNSSIHSSESGQDNVQSILSKFPTRKCSVNLGQKLSLEDLRININLLSHNKAATQDVPSALTTVSADPKERTDFLNTRSLSHHKATAQEMPGALIAVPSSQKASTTAPSELKASTAVSASQKAATVVPTNQKAATVVPTNQKASTTVPTSQKVSTTVPSNQKALTTVPSSQKASATAPTGQTVTATVPTSQKASTATPSGQKALTTVPTSQKASTAMPSSQKASTTVPTSQKASTATPSSQNASTTVSTSQKASTTVPTSQKPSTALPTSQKATTVVPTTQKETSDFPNTRNESHNKTEAQEMPSALAAVPASQKEKSDFPSTMNVSSKSSRLNPEVKQIPVVCLERNDKIDMYATKPSVSSSISVNAKKLQSKSAVQETKPVEYRKQRDNSSNSKHNVQTNGQVMERDVQPIVPSQSSSTANSVTQSSNINADLDSQLCDGSLTSKACGSTLDKLEAVNVASSSFHSTQGMSTPEEMRGSGLKAEAAHLSSGNGSCVSGKAFDAKAVVATLESIENSGFDASSTCCEPDRKSGTDKGPSGCVIAGENAGKCVSENVPELCSPVLAQPVTLCREDGGLNEDGQGAACSKDTSGSTSCTPKDHHASINGEEEKGLANSALPTQDRNSDSVEIPFCHEANLDQAEHHQSNADNSYTGSLHGSRVKTDPLLSPDITEKQQFTEVKDSVTTQCVVAGSGQTEVKEQKNSVNSKALNVDTESFESGLNVHEADLDMAAEKSSCSVAAQSLQQCATSLAATEISEKVNSTNLDTADYVSHIVDTGSSLDEGTHSELSGIQADLSHTKRAPANIVPTQDDTAQDDGLQVCDQSSHASTGLTGAVGQLGNIPDGLSSAVVSGSAQELPGSIDGHGKQSSTSRDERGVPVTVANPQASTANEKSSDCDTSRQADMLGASITSTTLSTRQGSAVGARKQNETPRRQDNKARANLNPSISLAAFIAERLTKEDLEPLNRVDQAQMVTVRQTDPDSPLDIGKRSQADQNFPLYVGQCSRMDQNTPLDMGQCSRIDQNTPLDMGQCSQIEQNTLLEIDQCSQPNKDSPSDIGQCSQPNQDSPSDIGQCSQPNQDSPSDIDSLVPEPTCITLMDDPPMEISELDSDKAKASQSSCLVDYSSSESDEEQSHCNNKASSDRINLQSVHNTIGESCLGDSTTAMEVVEQNSANTSQTTACINTAKMRHEKPIKGKAQVCQDKDIGFQLPCEKIEESTEQCLLQCIVSKEKQQECSITQKHSGPLAEPHCPGSEQCEGFESLLDENIIDTIQNEPERISEIQPEGKNFRNPRKSHLGKLAEELDGNNTQITKNSLGKPGKDLLKNTCQCVTSVVTKGNCNKLLLPTEEISQSATLTTGDQACNLVGKGIDHPVGCSINEGKQSKLKGGDSGTKQQIQGCGESTVVNGRNLVDQLSECGVVGEACEVSLQVSHHVLRDSRDIFRVGSVVEHCDVPEGSVQGRLCDVAPETTCSVVNRGGLPADYDSCVVSQTGHVQRKEAKEVACEVGVLSSAETSYVVTDNKDSRTINILHVPPQALPKGSALFSHSSCGPPSESTLCCTSQENSVDTIQATQSQIIGTKQASLETKTGTSGTQQWEHKNSKHSSSERIFARDLVEDVAVSGATELHSKVRASPDQFDGMAACSENDVTLKQSNLSIYDCKDVCTCGNNICQGSCVSSLMARDISSETNNLNPGPEESTMQHDPSLSVDKRMNPNPDSPSERRNTDNETDEGDDMSDFDLVIENDTSYRSMAFPITLEKKSYSPVPPHSSGSYHPKGKTNYPLSSANAPTPISGLAYNRVQDNQQPSPPLTACVKNLRKTNHGQFVWEVDGDSDRHRKRLLAESSTIPFAAFKHKSFTSEGVPNPALEALNRKQKALREKTETAPFTWDLEDYADSSISNASRYSVSSKISKDILSFDTSKRKNSSVTKAHRKISQRKRPLTPDVSHSKMPAKFRRTSSVDRQTKTPSISTGKELKKQQGVKRENETLNTGCSLNDSVEKLSNNSITVDEDVSFKLDPFSTPCLLSASDRQTGNQVGGSHETKLRRRERSQKHYHTSQQPTAPQHDKKFESLSQTDELESLKSLPGLRSRHSSMESNKSATSKKSSDSISQTSHKRFRRSDDSLNPKLKKIGLIKITKESNSPPAASVADLTAPMTRSSEAAIKAFNQKSLRSRGVNPVQSLNSQLTSTATIVPQIVQPKSSSDASPKLKTSMSVQKLSPLSSNIVRTSSTEVRAESSVKSYHIDNTPSAIVKRRSPTITVKSSPGSVHVKTPVALRSRKSISGHSQTAHSPCSTTIFRVDPLPGTKGVYRSQVIQSTKGIKTIHATLLPDTSTKKDPSKQPKWKIKKETRLGKDKKQQRASISFKRT